MMEKNFLTAVKDRRTYYGISKEPVIADERIQQIITDAVKYTPSSFNSQSARVVILLGEQHDSLWDITLGELRKVVPAENFAPTEEKINSFRKGYATVLFFEDMAVVEKLQNQFSLYKDNFPIWSNHSSGMLQYVVWTALEIEGFGVSLQHYSPLIDAAVSEKWQIPANWKLIAQMPFGKPTAAPGAKDVQPLEQRVKIYK
ncbi:nitroreductase family protein [Sporomusa aerivorans]|uniref:nitroreductase family protein n=1 Tax=Sporomusa aerivorans TaxID=204936 RepID=UPI00352A56D1